VRMTETLVNFSLERLSRRRPTSVVLLSIAAISLGGCAERKVHANSWATVSQVRPRPPVVRNVANFDSDIAPDFAIVPPENVARIFNVRPAPARPRAESPRSSAAATSSKTPTLVPELSPQETATAQQQFSESVSIAEKNLGIAKTKSLSAFQADTVAKINAFLADAREASAEGDWGRARNLAKKAQILSEDLAASF